MRGWSDHPVAALGAAALAGGAAALGQAPWSVWPLSLAGFGLATWLVADARSARGAMARAWIFGTAHFALALEWITEPFQVDAALDGWMAPFAWGLFAAGLALFWLLAGLAAGLTRGGRARRAGVFALALAALEGARGVVLSGFPWALPGHVWLDHAPAQLASVLGVPGLTLLTLGLAALPVISPRRGTLLAAALLGGAFGWGAWRQGLDVPDTRAQGDRPLIRLVQPVAIQALKWDPQHAREFFYRQLDMSAAPVAADPARRPDLVVWPETSVQFLLDDPYAPLQMIVDAAAGSRVALGIQRTEGLRGWNSLAFLGPDATGEARVEGIYDKHKLAPFGEYVPLGDTAAEWLGIFAFSPAEGNGYSAGPGPRLMALPGLPVMQPLICYEAVFPWMLADVPERPEWLLQVTNDAWFGLRSGPWQHLALTRARAIESGLPMMRVANTGVSAVIDARGRVLDALGMEVIGFIDATLPPALPPTIHARFGAWPATVLWLLLAAILLGCTRRQRSSGD